jgi:preprotein translocase subunit YajC
LPNGLVQLAPQISSAFLAQAGEGGAPAPGATGAPAGPVGPGGCGEHLSSAMFPLVMVMFIVYFMIVRPEQKRVRRHGDFLGELKQGEEIVTTGGLVGTIQRIEKDDPVVLLEVAPNVRVKVVKSQIQGPRPRPGAPGGGAEARVTDKNKKKGKEGDEPASA